MGDTAEIRKHNKSQIMKLMRSGREYTKHLAAAETGLSVATCNTLMNELVDEKKIIGEKCRLNDVGRSTTIYKINEDFESILCICYELLGGVRRIFTKIISPSGKIIFEKTEAVSYISGNEISQAALAAIEKYPNVSCIVIGNLGMAENGVISHCDVPEMNGVNLFGCLHSIFGLPIIIENDMYFKAIGCYIGNSSKQKIITLMNFYANVLPGTATIYKGTVLKGKDGFAGMVGFLPYDMTQEQYIEKMNPSECIPLISRAAASIIAVLNPNEMVFTGNLLNEEKLAEIYNQCLLTIPDEYMPEFSLIGDFEEFYVRGMYYTAIKGEM